jgi:hypothetical protein
VSEQHPPELNQRALREIVRAAGFTGQISGAYQPTYLGRFSNDVWRLDLEHGPQLIAKQAFRPHRSEDLPDVERTFYRTLAHSEQVPLNQLKLPKYIGELDGVLLLEYQPLRPFSFRSGVLHEHACSAIDALADWHAAWWERAPNVAWLPRLGDAELLAGIQKAYDTGWANHGERLLESAPAFRSIGEALVGRLASTLAGMTGPTTLIHGDAHAENLPLTENGQVLILDWQEPKIANPGYDLAVFTSMSFRQADRSRHEATLLQRHVERLANAGCRWPDPWQDYRFGLLRRAARIVEIAHADFPSLPWVFRRSAMAAVEQNVGSLIH